MHAIMDKIRQDPHTQMTGYRVGSKLQGDPEYKQGEVIETFKLHGKDYTALIEGHTSHSKIPLGKSVEVKFDFGDLTYLGEDLGSAGTNVNPRDFSLDGQYAVPAPWVGEDPSTIIKRSPAAQRVLNTLTALAGTGVVLGSIFL